jgi:NAD(P)-dependent dehydrogenase (short-subunit alcohol dehydrogenase family)
MAQRTVLVTGGNRGIGRAIAERFVRQGDKVAATYRNGPVPDGVFGVRCDITDPADVDAAFTAVEEELGPVEVLVANAGIIRDGLLLRMSEDDFNAVVQTNLTGPWRCTKRATGKMLRARWGRLIYLSSASAMGGQAGQTNYAASKAGLIGLARSTAKELGSRGITSNVVAPGLTETDMAAAMSEDQRTHVVDQTPLRRLGQPDEIAAAVAFLASDDAAFITGAVLPVDGGVGMGH